MPLSKFAISIAQSLTEYLTVDNSTPLDLSDSLDMAQQAIGTVANVITASYSYFWSKPAPTPINRYGITPPQYQFTGNSGGGKVGVERAMDLARLFDVVYKEDNLTYALSSTALIGGISSRRSELISFAFNIIDPGNKLQNRITQDDCKRIIKFIEKKDGFFPSRAGDRILATIKAALEISPYMIEEEATALTRGGIELPNEEDDDFEIVPSTASTLQNYDNSEAPPALWKPEEAQFKVIYDEAVKRREALRDEFISPISARSNNSNNSTPLSDERRSSTSSSLRS